MEELVIQGDEGEGGGQVLRTSLTLSAITGKPFRLVRIRGKRPNPGLQKQHLTCVVSTAQICAAQIQGDHLKSSEIHFVPSKISGGDFHYDLQGAGSTMLVAQTLLPVLAFAPKPSSLTLLGGTHNDMAPPFDFVAQTLFPWTRKMGFHFDLELARYGFYPRGGGKIIARIQPYTGEGKTIQILDRGKLLKLQARILHTHQSPQILEEEKSELVRKVPLDPSQIQIQPISESSGPGNVLILEAFYEHGNQMFTSFCPKEGSPREWVKAIVTEYHHIQKTSALVEEYLSDQLLLYMALKRGGSFFTPNPLSLHTTTNMNIIEKFLPVKFSVTPYQEHGSKIQVTSTES